MITMCGLHETFSILRIPTCEIKCESALIIFKIIWIWKTYQCHQVFNEKANFDKKGKKKKHWALSFFLLLIK